MKTCPFCAEEIQDEAIKCRYCGSDLDAPSGTAALPGQSVSPTPAASPPNASPTFSHQGNRFLLGYTSAEYGIWDRLAPGPPVQRYPKTDEGWRAAWAQFSSWEPAVHPAVAPGFVTPYSQAPQTNGMAIASLVLGILWLYGIGSILALIFGYQGKNQIDQSGGAQGGRGMAVAGIVLGWVGIAGLIILIIGAVSVSTSGY